MTRMVALLGGLLAAAAMAAGQSGTVEVKSYRDWKHLRAHARTAPEFHKLAEWCGTQAEASRRKAADYEAELNAYRDQPNAWRGGAKNQPAGQNLKILIAHYRDLEKHWTALGASMKQKAAELEIASAAR